MLSRRLFLAGLPLGLSGCVAARVWSDDEIVEQAVYRHPGPKSLTLFTMKNTASDNGAHTGLMINASQRVMFDPAGTFELESVPERNDVLFGITPRILEYYRSYHARVTYYITEQYIEVSADQAEAALRLALANGPVPKAGCTRTTSTLLNQVPGFEGQFRLTFLPDNLERQFAKLPGVITFEHREYDADDKSARLQEFDAQIAAGN